MKPWEKERQREKYEDGSEKDRRRKTVRDRRDTIREREIVRNTMDEKRENCNGGIEKTTGLSIHTTPSPHLVEDVYMRTDSMKSVRHSGEESGPGLQSSLTRIKVSLASSVISTCF